MEQNYTIGEKRNPTKWEIEGAKLLRTVKITEEGSRKFHNLTAFLQDTFFEIQDYGINDEISEKIRNQLLKYRRVIPRAQKVAERIFTTPQEETPVKKQTYLDIAIQVIRYATNNELRVKEKLDKNDVLDVMRLVAEYYSVPYEKCITSSRRGEYVLVRTMTALLCSTKTSTVVIGSAINRDHSTVIQVMRKLRRVLEEKPKEMENYLKLRGITGL